MKKLAKKKLSLQRMTVVELSRVAGGKHLTIMLPPDPTGGSGSGGSTPPSDACTVGCDSVMTACHSIDICTSRLPCA